jgi:hypothetical protein
MFVTGRRWAMFDASPVVADGSPSNKTLLAAEVIEVKQAECEPLFELLRESTALRGLVLHSRLSASVIETLPAVEWLHFPDGLGSKSLEALSHVPTLRSLELGNVWDRGASFTWLASLPRLESLQLNSADDALALHLGANTSLREVVIDNSSLTAQGLEALSQLPNLWALRLGNDDNGDEAFASLSAMRGLRAFSMPRHNHASRSGLGDATFQRFEQLPLELIVIEGCSVGDRGLASLPRIGTLQWVELTRAPRLTRAIKQSANAFTMPHVVIEDDDSPLIVKRRTIEPSGPLQGRQLFWWETAAPGAVRAPRPSAKPPADPYLAFKHFAPGPKAERQAKAIAEAIGQRLTQTSSPDALREALQTFSQETSFTIVLDDDLDEGVTQALKHLDLWRVAAVQSG